MASGVELSQRQFPPSTNPAAPATNAAVLAAAGGKITRGSLYRSMRGVWPAVDAVNGPLTADAGITDVAPSFTGMRFVPWDSGLFNFQSQNMVPVPASNGPAAGAACQNTTTDRGQWGSSGIGTPCHSDFSINSDTARFVLQFWQNPNGMRVGTSYSEVQIFAELEGQIKGIRKYPAAWPSGAASNKIMYRAETFLENISKEIICWMSANCWLMGVWVDAGANVFKTPNRPVLDVAHTNSWWEGNGNVFDPFGGNGGQAGVGRNNASALYSCIGFQKRLTDGFALGNAAQGGTQWKGNNGGIGVDEAVLKGFSSTLSTNQVNNAWNRWGTRFPTIIAGGNYNDGDAPVAGSGTTLRDNYKALVRAGLDKVIAKFTAGGIPTVPIILWGGEPKLAVAGAPRDFTSQGILAAGAELPNNVIGMILFFLDWLGDVSARLGTDGLHPLIAIAEAIGDDMAKRMSPILMDASYVNKTIAASHPISVAA